jgi:hypothetical protein
MICEKKEMFFVYLMGLGGQAAAFVCRLILSIHGRGRTARDDVQPSDVR